MEFNQILSSLFEKHLLVAAALGGLIGLEREIAGKAPSVRTFALISMGSCIFSLISIDVAAASPHVDPSRIAAQIVSGIGFIGAGTIFRSPKGVSGFTTAALMWTTAGIGMAVGFDRINLGLSATIIAITVTVFFKALYGLTRPLRSSQPKNLGNDG